MKFRNRFTKAYSGNFVALRGVLVEIGDIAIQAEYKTLEMTPHAIPVVLK